MEKWIESIAIITGGNSGNGFGIMKKFAEAGITVVSLDIKTETIEKFRLENKSLKVHSLVCDVTDDTAVKKSFKWVEENFGGVDILVNNAGLVRNRQILNLDQPMSDLAFNIDLNFTAYVRCARMAFESMQARNSYGYIININSIFGHSVPMASGIMFNVYPGTKYAITATTEIIRQELATMNNRKVRVASVSPGLVDTNFFIAAEVPQGVKNSLFMSPHLTPSDIAETVAILLTMPFHISINELTVRATGTPF